MFPNNPSFMEKLVQTKQAEIMREIPDSTGYDLPEEYDFLPEPRQKHKVWVLVGLLTLLGWLFSLIV